MKTASVLAVLCILLIHSSLYANGATAKSEPAIPDNIRAITGLDDDHVSQLGQIDLQDINDMSEDMNCFFRILAAFKGTTVAKLVMKIKRHMEASGVPNIEYITDLYRDAGFGNMKYQTITGGGQGLADFLDTKLAPGQKTSFALVFERFDGTRHVILARAWKEANGVRYFLSTDFQLPLGPSRFSTSWPDARSFWLILPEEDRTQTRGLSTKLDNIRRKIGDSSVCRIGSKKGRTHRVGNLVQFLQIARLGKGLGVAWG